MKRESESMGIDDQRLRIIRDMTQQVRKNIIEMIYTGGSGHPGGSLSAAEILTALYFEVMHVRPEEPAWPGRDRFVLSKGHAAPLLYAVLAERGFFPKEWLMTFQQDDSRLQKHIDMRIVPGAEVSTGSLGQGLSVAVGMALAAKLDKADWRVYVLIGDGESQEGQIWEAALAAAQFKLDNLIVFLDWNGLQVDGPVDEINCLDPIEEKWRSFRWQVQRVNGHNLEQIVSACEQAQQKSGMPNIIIADTVKGKGVSFMEDRVEWHARPLTDEQYQIALSDLRQVDASSTAEKTP